jgi:hypothetical protein
MKRILSVFLLLITLCLSAHSQAYGDLPPNPIGIVNYNTPGTFVNYSYSFTAPTTGVDYFGIAIRQDPGYWGIGNFSITSGSSTTNLFQNPNLQYGGTTNTQYGLQAPADWGIWYQSGNGAPPAAGQYYAPGQGWMGTYTGGLGVNTSTAGSWIDGAVGTFDGIYQGIRVTAGTTYNFGFSLNGTNSSSNPSIEIGAYAGACASGSTIFTCTPSPASGFTADATPADTQGTGGAPIPPDPAPSSPTITGTSTTDQVVVSSSTGSETATTNNYSFSNQTYIVTGTSTPTTITTTTTPVTTTTWSDGTTTTSNGTPTTTSSVTYDYNVNRPTNLPVSPYVGTNINGVYIQQSTGYTNVVGAYQSGHGNYENIKVTGNNNNVTTGQGYTFNSIGISSESVTPSNYNVLGLNLSGSNNNISTSQVGLSNSAIISITGNTNTATINQAGNNNQAYNIINGTGNALTVSQTGNGHLSAINLYGNNNVASVTQTGSNNSSVLNLTNAGGPNNISLIQTGTNDNYSFQQICTSPSGCGVTVIRH